MLDGKLRIAPTCYHVLHLIPVMSAHEMNFFYDEGLQNLDGAPAYEILRDSMVPFGLEKLGISQAMKEKSVDIPAIKDVCAQPLVEEAFKEVKERQALQQEYERVKTIAQKWGY